MIAGTLEDECIRSSRENLNTNQSRDDMVRQGENINLQSEKSNQVKRVGEYPARDLLVECKYKYF